MLSQFSRGALLACAVAVSLSAQAPQSSAARGTINLRFATFDPTASTPEIPASLRATQQQRLRIVQFHGTPSQAGRDAITAAGGQVLSYMPHDAYVVRMTAAQAKQVAASELVRWVGAYHPAYRLEAALLEGGALQSEVATRYNMVVADKHTDKPALAAKIAQLGGAVVDEHFGSLLFTASLTGKQLQQVAGF
ncbi:MAG: hypothetical protein VXY92_06715, partial [Planctomycetota bacterium]|nr:hypothetical protein [Planctomycetota bacterium]